jgi:hypothetical protein
MSNPTEQLVDAIAALVAAERMGERLKNPESADALSKAKAALVDILERWKGK